MTDAEIKALIVDILGSIAPEADAGALAGDDKAGDGDAALRLRQPVVGQAFGQAGAQQFHRVGA